MSVERTHAGHQTRYELRDEAELTYTADPDEPATWKILLPAPDGTEDLYGTQRFPTQMPRGSRAGSAPSWAAAMPPNSPAPSMPHRRRQPPGDRAATPTDHLVHGRPPPHSPGLNSWPKNRGHDGVSLVSVCPSVGGPRLL